MADLARTVDAPSELSALEKRLVELKRRLGNANRDLNAPLSWLVTVRIGGGRYALPLECTREFLRFAKLSRVPSAPDFVIGSLNMRGESRVVIDPLRLWGGQGVAVGLDTAIALIETCSRTFGVVVDRVENVVSSDALGDARADDTAAPLLSACVWRTLRDGTELVQVLDPARLLAPALIRDLDEALDRALELAARAASTHTDEQK